MADIKQWVNLEKDAKWANHLTAPDKPTDEERVGAIHLKVKFKNTKQANFKTRVKQVGKDPRYNKKEQARNQNFIVRYANGASTNVGKNEVELERDIYLLAAGGAEFTFEAKHRKKKVEVPKKIETRRALFFYSVLQDSTGAPNGSDPNTGAVVPGQISNPAALCAKLHDIHWTSDHPHYIWLEDKGISVATLKGALGDEYEQDPAAGAIGPTDDVAYNRVSTLLWRGGNKQQDQAGNQTVLPAGSATGGRPRPPGPPWHGVWRTSTSWEMLDAVKGALPRGDLQQLRPSCFVVVWCNYIADRAKRIVKINARRAGSPDTTLPVASRLMSALFKKHREETLYIWLGKPAWHGFNATDDANKSWLIDVKCRFVPADGSAPQDIVIPRGAVDLNGPAQAAFGGYNWLRIHLAADMLKGVRKRLFGTTGSFEFTLTYYAVLKMSCGYAMPGLNVVVVCDKANWRKMGDDEKLAILSHELGHAIGMTAQGGKAQAETFNQVDATTPDFPASLYGNIQKGRNENSCGHQGNHCRKGAVWTKGAWDATANNSGGGKGRYKGTWSGTPECVMFGQIGLGGKTNPPTYCGPCKPIVRKLDLGGEIFARCVTD